MAFGRHKYSFKHAFMLFLRYFFFGFEFQDVYDSNILYTETKSYCYHDNETTWTLTIYIYKSIVLVFGVFFAWENHKINNPFLIDATYSAASIYNAAVMCLLGVPLVHVLPVELRTPKLVTESCVVVICATVCQCIIFVPKVRKSGNL